MSIDTEILPISHVEELVRSIVKALRAFQMYLPNNPMYQRAETNLRDAFPPVWAVLDELTLFVRETDLVWEDQLVYEQPSKNESFAWGLYKDGMRVLTLRKGVEDAEIGRFLQTVTRARHLSADASDDGINEFRQVVLPLPNAVRRRRGRLRKRLHGLFDGIGQVCHLAE